MSHVSIKIMLRSFNKCFVCKAHVCPNVIQKQSLLQAGNQLLYFILKCDTEFIYCWNIKQAYILKNLMPSIKYAGCESGILYFFQVFVNREKWENIS